MITVAASSNSTEVRHIFFAVQIIVVLCFGDLLSFRLDDGNPLLVLRDNVAMVGVVEADPENRMIFDQPQQLLDFGGQIALVIRQLSRGF